MKPAAKKKPSTYCQYVRSVEADKGNPHVLYHNTLYGFPLADDNELFGRLILEINQAGLSWTTILNKERGFRSSYHNFDIEKVAAYKERDVNRLLADAQIIRNRLKVRAAIENARRILVLAEEWGSFKGWLDHHHPQSVEAWTKIFKTTFTFTGGEIVKEFLLSTGYLPGAHEKTCPVHAKILSSVPPWLSVPHHSKKVR